MKKHLVSIFAVLLICATIMSVAVPASAVGIQKDEYTTRASSTLITMVPNENITNLWTTNRSSGSASFVPGNINTGNTLTLFGSFQHSSSSGYCKAGVCIFSNGSAVSKLSVRRLSGYPFNYTNGNPVALGSLSTLDSDTTHYGFVKNDSSSGYVYNVNAIIGIT